MFEDINRKEGQELKNQCVNLSLGQTQDAQGEAGNSTEIGLTEIHKVDFETSYQV